MDVIGRATQDAKAEDEGRCCAVGPHPNPLGKCSRPCTTSCAPAVVPQGEAENDTHYLVTGSVSACENTRALINT